MAYTHFVKLIRPKKSFVYDIYWLFARKRLDIFLARLSNPIGPWTDDPILNKFRFTNVFRAADRVSQYLIHLQYSEQDPKEIFFKTLLFKIFNKIETYNYLEKKLNAISYRNFSVDKYDKFLTERMTHNKTIYSAAYIMPSAGNVFGYKFKHTNHLELLMRMLKDNMPDLTSSCKTLNDVYSKLLSYPSIGKFLAFQYTIDLNYSTILNFSEMDFVIAGPGAQNGINKCFESLGDYTFEDVIKMMADTQELECNRLNIEPIELWGRPLQLIDCQNIFCEVDKYLRASNPELNSTSGRSRIKQKYSIDHSDISLFFPPKWDINHKIPKICQEKPNGDIFS
ncbi:nucleotide kinase domain-containing protein [Chitinophaga varians]|uniref:nucleotide kinase domain-containing protein n=1 Tax=Chitinophaga varians TaxID=2202339 RepID=UPI00165ED02C|nr:nucleotide kinase domain-containing protein [Chitinophaga varians]MBC9911044.1 hypothetical protein [Chitinophaga varians]